MNLESSTFSVLVSFVVAILVSAGFYFKDKKLRETAGWLKLILTTSRFFIVLILVFLLFKPLTTSQKEEVRNSIFPVLVDNSKSILISDPLIEGEVKDLVGELKRSFPETDLKIIPFSNGLKVGDSLNFKDQGTNLSSAISELQTLFPSANIGNVLVLTDGIFTEGARDFNLNQTPLYLLGLGDTIRHPDAFVQSVFHNDIAFLGDEFKVEVNLKFKELENQAQTVKVFFGGKKVFEKSIKPKTNNELKKLKIKVKAEKAGEIPLKVLVSSSLDEKNNENNKKTTFVNVKEKKLNLLLVYSSPHPDVRLVKSAFFGLDHINIQTSNFDNTGFDLTNTSVVFFIGNGTDETNKTWLNKIVDHKVGFVWLTGARGRFNNDFFGLKKLDDSFDDVITQPNPDFTKFNINQKIKESFSTDLPIAVPFGKWLIKGEKEVMSFQTVNGVETNLPLVTFSQKQGVQFALLIGEGYWRLGLKNKKGLFDFLRKSVNVVAVKVDDSKLQLESFKEFDENDDVVFKAKFWNQAGELDNLGEVSAVLKMGDSIVNEFTFLKAAETYRLNIGKLKEGAYLLKTTFKKGGVILKKNSLFIVRSLKIESENLVANHKLLQSIASNNNGMFFSLEQRNELLTNLKSSKNFKSVSYFESISDLLIKQKWILFLLIGLISIEWFIRKWQGTI